MSRDKSSEDYRSISFFCVLLIFTACVGGKGVNALQSSNPQSDKPNYVEGELLVQFKDDVTSNEIEKINNSLGATISKGFQQPNLFLIKLPPTLPTKKAVEAYIKLPQVKFAEPNFIYSLQ